MEEIIIPQRQRKLDDLIGNADIIFIDETDAILEELEGVELVYLNNLGKLVYYTTQRLEKNMPYDEVIKVNWVSK